MAAGNLMRQAVEGIAVAVLCSNKDLLIIEQKKNTPTTARYWEKLVAGDPRVHGHRAVALLAINQTSLGISADAVTRLKQARSHYNLFSCCVPCDHVPIRSWPLFKARDVMRGVIESFKEEKSQ